MATLADQDWRLVRDEARDGATQMALEEVAAETAIADDVRTVRVFSWEPSTLSLGYRQDAETVDWEFCESEGIDVTRRQTGGGGIYHDRYADVSYTVVAPADELPGDLMDCYELLCRPILRALSEMGVDAAFASEARPSIHGPSCYLRDINPAHDVVVPGEDGGKISGNAQYRRRETVIQHGSLSFDLEPERHLGVFADHEVTPETFDDRVTSIREQVDIDREEAVRTLEEVLGRWFDAAEANWSGAELDRAERLAAEKYDSDAWIRDRTDPTE